LEYDIGRVIVVDKWVVSGHPINIFLIPFLDEAVILTIHKLDNLSLCWVLPAPRTQWRPYALFSLDNPLLQQTEVYIF
jgi:hypothetical protein